MNHRRRRQSGPRGKPDCRNPAIWKFFCQKTGLGFGASAKTLLTTLSWNTPLSQPLNLITNLDAVVDGFTVLPPPRGLG